MHREAFWRASNLSAILRGDRTRDTACVLQHVCYLCTSHSTYSAQWSEQFMQRCAHLCDVTAPTRVRSRMSKFVGPSPQRRGVPSPPAPPPFCHPLPVAAAPLSCVCPATSTSCLCVSAAAARGRQMCCELASLPFSSGSDALVHPGCATELRKPVVVAEWARVGGEQLAALWPRVLGLAALCTAGSLFPPARLCLPALGRLSAVWTASVSTGGDGTVAARKPHYAGSVIRAWSGVTDRLGVGGAQRRLLTAVVALCGRGRRSPTAACDAAAAMNLWLGLPSWLTDLSATAADDDRSTGGVML